MIQLKSVPEDTTKTKQVIHFTEMTREAVVAVYLTFNNSKDIDMYVQRVKVMQSHYKCMQKIHYNRTIKGDN